MPGRRAGGLFNAADYANESNSKSVLMLLVTFSILLFGLSRKRRGVDLLPIFRASGGYALTQSGLFSRCRCA